jgi:hypothetical protein
MNNARDLLAQGYGEEGIHEGSTIEHVENEQMKVSEEDRELASREDIDSLPHMMKIRIGFIKRQIEAQEGKDDDNGNPNS